MVRPLLFLDVDGTLLPNHPGRPALPGRTGRLARLDPADGPRLLALSCDLVWATAWMDEANEVIGPALGLPPLPVVDFDEVEQQVPWVHWKTEAVTLYAAGRPFAWVDDEVTDADREWVAYEHPAPALLHLVDAGWGITSADFDTIAAWLALRR